jgi:hypothetical protein
MRDIVKSISVSMDGKPMDFRLTKLDAFSGASLLRMLSGMRKNPGDDSVLGFITSLSEPDLRSLMITCLQHCEVLLPAGWMPVMTRGEWTVSELEHDTAVCLTRRASERSVSPGGCFAKRKATYRPHIGNSSSRPETV